MRKVTYGGAVSLDGLLTGPDETMDWLRWTEDSAAISQQSWEGVDTILMGRKTYEFAARSGGAASNIKTYIFSRTMTQAPGGTELVEGDAASFVRQLKEQPGGNIIVMGGGELGTALIEGGVVDEIGLNVHPVLLGGGTPAFGLLSHRIELNLVEARPLREGCVFLRYRVQS